MLKYKEVNKKLNEFKVYLKNEYESTKTNEDEVFKHNNNLFGMRLAKQRLTLTTGDNLRHATYETVEESLYDRLIYEAMYLNKFNRNEYLRFLDRVYAEAGEKYSKMIESLIKGRNF